MKRIPLSVIHICVAVGLWCVLQLLPAYASEHIAVPQTTTTPAPDTSGPVFPVSGITFSLVNAGSFRAQWMPATDNVTAPSNLRYEACVSHIVNGCDVFAVHATSQLGVAHVIATGLIPSTTYYVKVRAIDGANNTSATMLTGSVNTLADTSKPSFANTTITFTGVTDKSFTATWNPATDDATTAANMRYDVCVSMSATGCNTFTPFVTTAAGVTTFTRTDVGDGLLVRPLTTYYVRVRAVDIAGNVSSTNAAGSVQATRDTTAPIFSGSISFTNVTPGGFRATWQAPRDNYTSTNQIATDVFVCTAADSGCGTAIPVSAGTQQYTVSGLTPASTYFFKIRARDGFNNESTLIGSVSTPADTTGPTFPASVISFSLITPASFKAQWAGATDDATGMFGIRYELCIATTNTGCNTFTVHASSQPGVAHLTPTGLLPSTTYFVKVRAVDGAGNYSSNMLSGSVTTLADTAGPSFASTSISFPRVANGYVARWNAASDNATPASALTYEVCIATTSTGCTIFTVTATTSAGVTTITRNGLIPNTTYYLKVRARDATGNVSANMAVGSLKTGTDISAPLFATTTLNFSAITPSSVTVSWTAAGDNVSAASSLIYLICVQSSATGCDTYPVHATTAAGATSMTLNGLNPNSLHYVTVWARDGAGNMSINSASGSITTGIPSPTNTFTPSRTRTSTMTMSATRTHTSTPTATATMTATRTRTSTPTTTATMTATRTRTSTRTSTPTATVTMTASRTRTNTSTATATMTATRTRTSTRTSTPTATATMTATMTSTPQPNQLIAPGGRHTCVLTTAGAVACWGYNEFGQLGNGTITSSLLPVAVTGLTSGVTTVSAGDLHTCAITATGGLKCWGLNNGRLGDGTSTQRTTPVDVVGLTSNVIAVAASDGHTCALTSSGGIKCWGSNTYGQLGDRTRTSRNAPVDVVGLTSGVVAIATGEYHTCALTSSGGVKCWGRANVGQIGDGNINDFVGHFEYGTPRDVANMTSGVIAITAGEYHTCALKSAGSVSVYCWGYNSNGQIGDGTQTSRNTPALVSALDFSGVAAITAGDRHTCVRTTAGAVLCWGTNIDGQLGDGSFTTRYIPTAVVGLTSGVTVLVAGDRHTCAITTGNRGMCWGGNVNGEVGDATTILRNTPVNIIGFVPLASMRHITAFDAQFRG